MKIKTKKPLFPFLLFDMNGQVEKPAANQRHRWINFLEIGANLSSKSQQMSGHLKQIVGTAAPLQRLLAAEEYFVEVLPQRESKSDSAAHW